MVATPASPLPVLPTPCVMMIASEAAPFAKTGGLGDVLGALPAAMSRVGWDALVVLPRYRGITAGREVDRFPLRVGGYDTEVGIFEEPMADGARALFIDDPRMFDREFIYGESTGDYADSPLRFAVLARAALEHAARVNIPVRVIHAHDWQAGLVPVYLKTIYSSHFVLSRAGVVITIHNLAYQGWIDPDWLPRLDLPWSFYTINQLEFYGRVNLLKGGVMNAGMVTTVSPQYAREIQTPSGGVGFDGILRSRGDRLVGILNGIDAREWDPMTDRFLPAPYSADDLSGKRIAKKVLLEHYGLASDESAMERPLIGMVSRMVEQKGLNLIEQLAGELPWLDAGFAILGTGESRYQDMWRYLASQHPWKIGVQHRLRRRISASHRGGIGHLPDAVAVRAVRPEPDVQPPLRHRPARAPRRRAGRHRDKLRSGGQRLDRFRLRRLHAVGPDRHPPLGARHLPGQAGLARPAGERDASGPFMGPFSSRVRQNIRIRSIEGDTLMAAENVQTFTDSNFDQTVLQSSQPVLVDFWAEWCGPCKRLGPTIDQLASEYAGKVTIGKLNVDENPNTAIKFQIRGIPAVMLFKDGQIVESVVGLAPKDDFKRAIDKHI